MYSHETIFTTTGITENECIQDEKWNNDEMNKPFSIGMNSDCVYGSKMTFDSGEFFFEY